MRAREQQGPIRRRSPGDQSNSYASVWYPLFRSTHMLAFGLFCGATEMSRDNWWSVAAILILTGIGYFVGREKAVLCCLIFGTIIAIILYCTRRKKEKNPVRPSPSMDDGANQTQTGSKFEQHIHPPPPPVFSERIPTPKQSIRPTD
jgi:hypothetical protein